MNNNLILIGIFLSIVIWCFYNQSTENYKPYINPPTEPVPPLAWNTKSAPWIPKKTPIPPATTLDVSGDTARILSESVDPGAHIECQNWCEKKSGKDKTKEFMQVCIDTCIQEKWRNPDSKLTAFKP